MILQICLPGLVDPTIHQSGGDFLSVHAWVPDLAAQIHWNHEIRSFRSTILDHLEHLVIPGLRGIISKEFVITPDNLLEQINRPDGTAHDPKCTFSHLAGFPPANYRTPIPNLFLVGEGAHYLPGISGALSSANLATQSITLNT
jgi:phytoene dehydrogenase-like protein